MARISYTTEHYESIALEEFDEGEDYNIGPLYADRSLAGVRLALLMGPCPEEPEIVVPLDYLRASGAHVDVIAPDWTQHDWLPAARFWAPTLKIPYQKKVSQAAASDYRGVILIGGTWNPAVIRTDSTMLEFVRDAAKRGLPVFSICHGAQILISAGLVTKGLRVTGAVDIRGDLRNAGADVIEDEAVVVDTTSIYVGESAGVMASEIMIVSSRNPNDLAAFCGAIAKHV